MNAKEAKEISSRPYQWLYNEIEQSAKSGSGYITFGFLMDDEIDHLKSLGYKVNLNYHQSYEVCWFES